MDAIQSRILVVSCDFSFRNYIKKMLNGAVAKDAGFYDGLAIFSQFDVIIIDHCKHHDAVSFIRAIRAAGADTPCAVLMREEPAEGLQGFVPANLLRSTQQKFIVAESLFPIDARRTLFDALASFVHVPM